MKKLFGFALLAAVVVFVAIQLVPYGRDHTNPPVTQPVAWPSPEAEAIARRACYDCHSNEVTWPWYSNVAPASWLVQHDVEEARGKLNFSAWGQGEQEVDDIGEVLDKGEMPPRPYLLMHPTAKLSASDISILKQAAASLEGGEAVGQVGEDEDQD